MLCFLHEFGFEFSDGARGAACFPPLVGVMPAQLFRCVDAFPGIPSFHCLALVSKLCQPYKDTQGVLAKK